MDSTIKGAYTFVKNFGFFIALINVRQVDKRNKKSKVFYCAYQCQAG